MKKIFFFSNNSDKVKEIKNLFKDLSINFFSLNDFNIKYVPKENGSSFSENAKIKSEFGFNQTQIPCFADDSGICIEALNWKPNIFSKRYIQSFKNKKDCFSKIIETVRKTGKRKAYFQTSICYTLNKNHHIVFEGKVSGRISNKIIGKKGFGYDPIFIPDGEIKTYSQMSLKEKSLISHRGIATNKFISFLFD